MATLAPEVPSLARDRAFETLYRRYVKDVYHYALALLRNPADAEDVTQTTFMNAYRAFKRGEEPIKPQNWLIRIAHNVARSRYAAAGRRVKEVPLEDHIEQLALPDDDKPDVEAVLAALGRLPLNQRAALVLRELEGRTYAEIADTLAVSVPAVETLIFRARRALRLKASAVRALGLVPLPNSLTQFLESGSGVAIGGSAALGSGFLLKALVAVVAGGALTGLINGTQRHGALAAVPAIRQSVTAVDATFHPARTRPSALATRHTVHRTAVGRVARPGRAKPLVRPAAVASSATSPASSQAPVTSAGVAAAAPTSPVTNAVSTATTTATGTTIPLAAPQVPSTPSVTLPPATTAVALPPAPELPKLP
jgi:RNA polymerase sigma factor (sigma-70 family)